VKRFSRGGVLLVQVQVQVKRCRGAEVQRCRGAYVQRCICADVQVVLKWCRAGELVKF